MRDIEFAFLGVSDNEMGEQIRAHDWSRTPLGPISKWPESLCTAVSTCLNSRFPMLLWWGADFTSIYNDAFAPVFGVTKHPWALGRSAPETWTDVWPVIGPVEGVWRTGVATWYEDWPVFFDRNVACEEVYFTYSYSPIFLESGAVGGILCACTETSQRVISERRMRTLHDLSAATAQIQEPEQVCEAAARVLADSSKDTPFALIYLIDERGNYARLAATAAIARGSRAAPPIMELHEKERHDSWPIGRVLRTSRAETVSDLSHFGNLPGGPWPESPSSAMVMPISAAGRRQPAGIMIAGISPRCSYDDSYRAYLGLLGDHVSTALNNALAYENERKRSEMLAELDRSKTEFFSNVGHEFRTPLTLMLGPSEDALKDLEGAALTGSA